MDAEDIEARLKLNAELDTKAAQTPSTGLTLRERWRKTMYFQKVDQIPNFEFGYWAETLPEWHKQGLPETITTWDEAYVYFGIENWRWAPANVGHMLPDFGKKEISRDDKYLVYQDPDGAIKRINLQGHKSIPQHIRFHLTDRKAWEEDYKPKLQAGANRLPNTWPELVKQYQRRDYPLCVARGSLVGYLRDWMGFEHIAVTVIEDPEWLEEMVEHICVLICTMLEKACKDVEFDFGAGWEDICFNSGPIVGVNFMRDVVMPRYKRISDVLVQHGCGISWTDCDGNILPVLDSFWGGGLNCCFPIEINAGSDPFEIRRRYPSMRLQGGFCKMCLRQDKAAVRKQLESLIPLVKEGGYIPSVDHLVQADAKLDLYKYYLKLKREIFGVGGTPQYDESKI